MVKTYSRRPTKVEALKIDKGSYSEAMLFIESAGGVVDHDCRAFIGIKMSDGIHTITAHHGDFLVLTEDKLLYVFDPKSFRLNFQEVKNDSTL